MKIKIHDRALHVGHARAKYKVRNIFKKKAINCLAVIIVKKKNKYYIF